jgi:hypothetical protein
MLYPIVFYFLPANPYIATALARKHTTSFLFVKTHRKRRVFRMSRTAADEGRLVYVGNLTDEVRERDLGEMFDKYGKIVHIEIKVPPRPPNFAFIEFGDWRYVSDANSSAAAIVGKFFWWSRFGGVLLI